MQEEKLVQLHKRHTAKIINKLQEINTAQIVIDAVNRQFSFYTTDIKEQVLNLGKTHDRNSTK